MDVSLSSLAVGSVRADLLDTAETALSDIRTVLISLVLVGAAWLLFRVFWQTKAITACLIALLTGGFVYFGVDNVQWLGERVSEQIREWSAHAPADAQAPDPVIAVAHAAEWAGSSTAEQESGSEAGG